MLTLYITSTVALSKGKSLPFSKGQRRNILLGSLTILVATGVGIAAVGTLVGRPHIHLRFSAEWLGVAIVGFAVTELLHAVLWRRLVIALGAQIELRRGLAIWCVSAIARYVPTNALMPVLRISMSRSQNVPRSICAASLVYEAALAVSAALFVGAYCLVGLPALRGDGWRWGVFLIPLMLMLALDRRGAWPVIDRLLRRLGQDPLPIHLGSGQLLRFTVGYVASFVLAGGCLVAVVLACHPLSLSDAPFVVSAYTVGFAAALVAFVLPGGLGAREAALVAVLSPIMPLLVATTIALVVRLLQIFAELLLALVTPWIAMRHTRRCAADANDRERKPVDERGADRRPELALGEHLPSTGVATETRDPEG